MPKMKTHKGAARRFKVTGSGQIMRTKHMKSHFRRRKSPRVKRMFDRMFIVIAIAVFVVVALGVFVIASLLDERSSKARLLRERLTNVQKTTEREAGESLALLRDEVLSKIPALDSLLRRSNRIASLQTLLEQADLKSRPGNVVLLGLVSGVA